MTTHMFDGTDPNFPDLSGAPFPQKIFKSAALAAARHNYRNVGIEHIIYALTEDASFRSIIEAAGGTMMLCKGSLERAMRDHAAAMKTQVPLTGVTGGVAEIAANSGLWQKTLAEQGEARSRSEFFFDIIDTIHTSAVAEIALQDCGAGSLMMDDGTDGQNTFGGMSIVQQDAGPTEKAAPKNNMAQDVKRMAPQTKAEKDREKENQKLMDDVRGALTDMVAAVSDGTIDPVFGRDEEIEMTLSAISRRRKSSVILYGAAGVGKTAIAEGVACYLANLDASHPLYGRPLYEVSLSNLVGGTKFRGDFEARMQVLVKLLSDENAIAFIDEFHMVVGAGSTYGKGMDGANMLKTALGRGSIKIIGATTFDEMREISQDRAMMRRFEPIPVSEMSAERTLALLQKAADPYLDHFDLLAEDGAFEEICMIADKYMPDKHFPDKAFELLDIAGQAAHQDGSDFLTAAYVRKAADRLRIKRPRVPSEKDIAAVAKLQRDLAEALGTQTEPLKAFTRTVQGGIMNVTSAGPRSTLALATPGSVDRFEIARILGDALSIPTARLDLSGMTGAHDLHKLIGLPTPQGIDHTGQLVKIAEGHREVVILVEGIAQVDPAIRDVIEAVLRDGFFRSADGRQLSLSHAWVLIGLDVEEEVRTAMGFGSKAVTEGDADIISSLSSSLARYTDGIVRLAAPDQKAREMAVRRDFAQIIAGFARMGCEITLADDEVSRIASIRQAGHRRAALQEAARVALLDQVWDGLVLEEEAKPVKRPEMSVLDIMEELSQQQYDNMQYADE